MWSDRYGYYEIRATADYGATANTVATKAVLDKMPELAPDGLMRYKNADGSPWVNLILAMGNQGNFNCFADTQHDEFNMIPIVCFKSEDDRVPAQQLGFFITLAKALSWELIEEENDEGQKDVIIWKPQ